MSNDKKSFEQRITSALLLIIMSGAGGTLPTLSTKAAYYVTVPNAGFPEPSFYFGLAIYFVIGAIIVYAVGEVNPRRAVLVGIAAPAIISGTIAGIDEGKAKPQAPQKPPQGQQQNGSMSLHTPFARLHDVSDEPVSIIKTTARQKDQKNVKYLRSQHTRKEIIVEAQKMPKNIRGPLSNNVIFIFESLDGTDWEPQPVADVAVGNAIKYSPSPGAIVLGFVAGDATGAIQIEGDFTGRICLKLTTESRSDFLWALGFRRSTKITGIHPEATMDKSCSNFFKA